MIKDNGVDNFFTTTLNTLITLTLLFMHLLYKDLASAQGLAQFIRHNPLRCPNHSSKGLPELTKVNIQRRAKLPCKKPEIAKRWWPNWSRFVRY